MSRKLLFLPIILWLSACSSSIFNKVYITNDEIKNERLALYNFDGKAISILKKSWHIPVHIQFKSIKGTKRNVALLNFSLNIDPSKKLVDTLYIKTGEAVFKIKAINMSIVNKQLVHHQSQSKVSKEISDKEEHKDQDIIKTEDYIESYPIKTIYLQFELPETLLNKFKTSEQMLMQFYVNNSPYNIKFKKAILNKIKKVYFD